ncbi:trypsin-like peptidase domain-containing protein [Sporocytophaga myxococcoides]|uniref:trypsin-like peptidase domain-containing protein n=1 Tax=Sporocytophaga myxococcoides TaxID=153721 RepID=UPI0006884931|nr:trypsin-like peptidase domain-containing protein [Sporocytophaga myxococcoides]
MRSWTKLMMALVLSFTGVNHFSYAGLQAPAPKDTNIVVPERMNFTYAAERSRPAVVFIQTYSSSPQGSASLENPLQDLLEELYGGQAEPPQGDQSKEKEQKPEEYPVASASGVIISGEGYIVSNNHVIEGADRIEIVLNDKRSYTAKIVGIDPETDLSLLKIEGGELTPIIYGNSDIIKIGEWVLAVGNPFNLTSTVTAGIVSAKGRNVGVLAEQSNMAIESFIQTDAVVNVGNSGGALVNTKGELIGINTAIASPTGSYAGYSFAVPSNIVFKVVEDLKKYGQVQRAILGVTIQDLDAALVKAKKIPDFHGVYVDSVVKGSSAADAGLQKGDIIKKIEGHIVDSPSELQEIVAIHRPGDKIKLSYSRGGKVNETEVLLKNSTGNTKLSKKDPNEMASLVGAQLRDLSKEEAKKFKVKGGVKIEKVMPGKFKNAGMKDGFIITHIDKIPVKSMEDATKIINKNKQNEVLVQGVYPNGEKAFYAIAF